MRKTIRSAVKQALTGKAFLLSAAGVSMLLFLASVREIVAAFRSEELLVNGFYHTLILNALSSDSMMLALPILAALPFTASVVEDVKCGFIKAYLPRTSLRAYIAGKVAAGILSGGLAFVFGIAAAYGIAALWLTPMEAADGAGAELPARFSALMGRVLLYFCSGAFWSMIGMLFAALTESKYMAYASPFVFYYVLIILYERYFDTLYVLYPKEWVMPSERWVFGDTGVVLFVAELTILAALCFAAAAKRRLSQI